MKKSIWETEKTESRELKVMRQMAWERAKGEIESMLCTYWETPSDYENMQNEFDKFVEIVECNGYQE